MNIVKTAAWLAVLGAVVVVGARAIERISAKTRL